MLDAWLQTKHIWYLNTQVVYLSILRITKRAICNKFHTSQRHVSDNNARKHNTIEFNIFCVCITLITPCTTNGYNTVKLTTVPMEIRTDEHTQKVLMCVQQLLAIKPVKWDTAKP
jgi:hypothetical protein